ncbi:MAG: hypothetical protein U5M53_13715 [Rhodoferax sp.]|nr:hypothetical protein [Rhodoferax sp.]
MTFDLLTILQLIGPAVAVYAAIRADMAAFHVRLDHIERDLYKSDK